MPHQRYFGQEPAQIAEEAARVYWRTGVGGTRMDEDSETRTDEDSAHADEGSTGSGVDHPDGDPPACPAAAVRVGVSGEY